MHWTEPATADDSHAALEKKLWDAANMLWAGADLKPSEYSPTVLGLIFLRYADVRFTAVEAEMGRDRPPGGPTSRRKIGPADYHAAGVIYLPDSARFDHLLQLPEGLSVGNEINLAMRAIEKENPDLADVLPKTYHILDSRTLAELLKVMASIPMDKGGDTFGLIYYEDLQDSVGRFDFVMANPPFNVSKIDKERLAGDPRYPFGIPRTDNGNYLWIQHFHSALNPKGRAGFVMANSAADARASEQEIREKIIRAGHVDVMVAIGPNFFFTVTLPCTLWFFDKGKSALPPSPPAPLPPAISAALRFPKGEGSQDAKSSSPSGRGGGEGDGAADYDYSKHVGARYRDTVLFIDARHIFRQLDRAHRDFTPAQIEFIANLVRLYRGQPCEFHHGSESRIHELFGEAATSSNRQSSIVNRQYQDVPGLCKAATIEGIAQQGWSLNPGRYVGVAKGEDLSDEDFKEKLEALNEELEVLNAEARELEARIADNVVELLEA